MFGLTILMPDQQQNKFPIYYAIAAILLIGVLIEYYPPLGYGLALLAIMGMIATYFSSQTVRAV